MCHFLRLRDTSIPVWPVDCSVEHLLASLMRPSLGCGGLREVPLIWFWPHGHNATLNHDS